MALANGSLRAALFDMDGVVTRTAQLHAAAWKQTFDDFLQAQARGAPFRPFDQQTEYRAYVDGKPREEGVRSFLQERGIIFSSDTEAYLATRKDALFERLVHEQGVQTYASTLELIEQLRAREVKIGVATSSRHGRAILESSGTAPLFDVCLDGNDLDTLHLSGKPNPDMFQLAVGWLGVTPAHAMIFEDAVAGVQAGRRGEFGLVVGIDRGDNAAALKAAGADIVVPDLAAVGIEKLETAFCDRQEEIAWRVEQEGFDRTRERQMESLFTVGNGYLGVRGALDTPLPESQCDLFIAGVYDHKRTDLPYSEMEFLAPDRAANIYAELVPLPFPFSLKISVEGQPLDFAGPYGRELRRVLDLRCGVLHSEAMFESPGGRRTAVRTRRCASLADPHLLLQEAVVLPENHWGTVQIDALVDCQDVPTRHPHLERLDHTISGNVELVRYVTRGSAIHICIASRALHTPNTLRRLISVFTSRDVDNPAESAVAHSQSFSEKDFDALLETHAAMWKEFWNKADIRVSGRPSIEQALRFGSYHLRLPAGEDPRVSIAARTLSGRAYEGHVFWDTEIFMLPFYLHTETTKARNLLLYRHHTLDGARRRAHELGYRGACYAWESSVTGDDVTPSKIVLKSTGKEIPIFTGTQQIHVTADIAYALWRYWETTGDEQFLAGPGAEILFETARFWMSRVTRGERHFHIRGVVGPDEYHHSVNDNAYTNWMARFNLKQAAWVGQHFGINQVEAQDWAALAESLYIPLPNEHGVIEQFEGFFTLADYLLPKTERFKAPVSRLFDWQQINGLKLLKQADVLMLPFLFPTEFSDEIVAANYRYYEPLTDHGSSLSPAVHAAIAARIGMHEDAEHYWKQSLWLDLSNAMENSTLGIHPAAMGGTWQALVFGFLGVHFDHDGAHAATRAAERLPAGWDRVELSLMYHGRACPLTVARTSEKDHG